MQASRLVIAVVAFIASTSAPLSFDTRSDEQYTRDKFDTFKGRTMTDVMNMTLRYPIDYVEDSRGRNFVYEFGQCSALLRTENVGGVGSDAWVVYGYSFRGWCGTF